jgi:chromosomal replication initiator protein
MMTATEQQANAKAVRDRLMTSKPKPQPAPTQVVTFRPAKESPTVIRRDTGETAFQEIARLKGEVKASGADCLRLRLNVADLQAVVIAQARQISELTDPDHIFVERTPVRTICAEILRDFPGITWEHIISARRTRDFIEPRHACFVAVYTRRPDLSLPQIGKIFDRDHTTILSAVQKHQRARKQ